LQQSWGFDFDKKADRGVKEPTPEEGGADRQEKRVRRAKPKKRTPPRPFYLTNSRGPKNLIKKDGKIRGTFAPSPKDGGGKN